MEIVGHLSFWALRKPCEAEAIGQRLVRVAQERLYPAVHRKKG